MPEGDIISGTHGLRIAPVWEMSAARRLTEGAQLTAKLPIRPLSHSFLVTAPPKVELHAAAGDRDVMSGKH